jgi:GT2 family glycosyltransferase
LGFNREGYLAEPCYSEVEIFGCCAGACLYTRKALEKVGLFDEDFKLYFEDFDLAFRLRNAGFLAYFCPKAVMWHYKNVAYNKVKNYFWSRNYTINFLKNMPLNIPLLLLTECIMLGMNLVKGRFEIIKAKWDAYKYVFTKLERQSLNKKTELFMVMKWRP